MEVNFFEPVAILRFRCIEELRPKKRGQDISDKCKALLCPAETA